MNKVIIGGRWTRDPDLSHSGELAIVRGTVAVDRRFKKDGEATADFITVKAFGKTAEAIGKYFTKGQKILATGHIQTGSYEKDGRKVYTTDVIIDEWEFGESKGSSGGGDLVQEGQIDGSEFVQADPEAQQVFNF